MIILLLQLSDIHLIGEDDAVLGRVQHIANAVRSVGQGADACTVIVSGDIAYAGSEDQYIIALEFFSALRTNLQDTLGNSIPISFVAVPGNHDCDFSSEQGVREIVIESVRKDPNNAARKEVIEVCTAVQDNFFDFLPSIGIDPPGTNERLYYERAFDYPGGNTVLYRCFNTAWTSQLQEKPGQMVYPVAAARSEVQGHEIVVTVLHHPYNWFQPEVARVLRKHVETTSDLILTGHEHDLTHHTRMGHDGEINEYVEGGVLQETGHDEVSQFNVILLELAKRQQKVYQFDWTAELYTPKRPGVEWRELQVNQLIVRNELGINEATEAWLEDPGATLTHSKRGSVKLSDIFVYPDLREVDYRSDLPTLVGSEKIINRMLEDKRVLITGPERSGKTSLLKALFRELHQRGLIPVYLDAEKMKSLYDDGLLKQVYRGFEEQYSRGALEKYKQLSPDKRVLLLDNFHALAARGRSRGNLA